jgi:2-aminoethylphosphonate-pyruvate transaminase
MDDDIPYLLLTPGPLTTSKTVKQVMLADFCTWDADYNNLVSDIRGRLVKIATQRDDGTSVLMQGSGTFAVEATIGSVIPPDGKLLAVNNGAYGKRIVDIAERLKIPCTAIVQDEREPADPAKIDEALGADRSITHVALVHCETTTGMLNPAASVGEIVRKHHKVFILDAMSSFGGIPLNMEEVGADYLVSSANQCLEGVPGFGFVIARRERLAATQGWARSLSLDLFDQWREMEEKHGKWRYTSPTHVVRAFRQALDEFDAEGGVAARHARYAENHHVLIEGFTALGFRPLLPQQYRSPIITSFLYPDDPAFTFERFYEAMKRRRFVLYPGKVSRAETFRVGTIGEVFSDDIRQLTQAAAEALHELNVRINGN